MVLSTWTAAVPILAIITTFLILPLGSLWFIFFRKRSKPKKEPQTFGFFHPYCSGGGGGERVLWKMIQVLQSQGKQAVIYTIDAPNNNNDNNEKQLRLDAEQRFDVILKQPVTLIHLHEYKDYLLPSPYLSLVLESIGTMKLAREGLKRFQPDVFCDTTGCAFTFAVVKWMVPRAYIMAYVHYPTISTDMMLWEWSSNSQRRKWKTVIKLIYYWIFAIAYGLVGSMADLVMVNSTWTYNHIKSLWKFSKQIYIVYPPCRVPSSSSSSTTTTSKDHAQNTTNQRDRNNNKKNHTIVSIGQFRPEKDHSLQLQALAKLFQKYPQHKDNNVQLVLIGSCRNDADQERVTQLQELMVELALPLNSVKFCINPPYSELQQRMQSASMGIHTMRQEHFGIGIVEMMAAGLVTIAHNSGGPKSDIIIHGETGYLAVTAEEYANAIHQAMTMEHSEEMRQKAQKAATRFSDQVFDTAFAKVLPNLSKGY